MDTRFKLQIPGYFLFVVGVVMFGVGDLLAVVGTAYTGRTLLRIDSPLELAGLVVGLLGILETTAVTVLFELFE